MTDFMLFLIALALWTLVFIHAHYGCRTARVRGWTRVDRETFRFDSPDGIWYANAATLGDEPRIVIETARFFPKTGGTS